MLLLNGFYSAYVDKAITFENLSTPLYIKIFPIMFIFLISEYFSGRYTRVSFSLNTM